MLLLGLPELPPGLAGSLLGLGSVSRLPSALYILSLGNRPAILSTPLIMQGLEEGARGFRDTPDTLETVLTLLPQALGGEFLWGLGWSGRYGRKALSLIALLVPCVSRGQKGGRWMGQAALRKKHSERCGDETLWRERGGENREGNVEGAITQTGS